ncbi:hypothetical protein EDF88_4301 [Buttiauxella sp. BIGb0552]|uniref:hypothetical protein n=1 Tax=Buttiauxella sp. BIGb0552 TaxID=2485120 RepID=UPI001065A3F7|nr:hypothetical protein [Buttiauxella sp. BIGb0552]TDX13020.1 hypothetical protein EDF88_4301 [Buttiauxella sp. BIGb0552]
MDKVLKVINILLLSIVGMLLLIGVMMLVQGSRIDLGKVADWWAGLSAVATAGTFAIALIALKKAPNWFKQKRNETGFNHTLSLMSEYDEVEHDIQRLFFDIINARRDAPHFNPLRDEIITIVYRIIALQSKLQSCKRWKIEASPEVENAFSRLKEFCNLSLKVFADERGRDIDALHESQQALTALKSTIAEDSKSFKTEIEEIFKFPK